MNIKLITKALHTLSLLSEEDYDLLMKLRSLSESEREALVLVLEPQTAKKKSTSQRVYERCTQCGTTKGNGVHKNTDRRDYHEFQSPPQPLKPTTKPATKSARASGMAEQLSSRRKQQPEASTHCAHAFNGGSICEESESSGIHDVTMGYQNYHPFVAPVATAASKSSRQSSVDGSGVNSGTEQEDAGVAASAGD